MRIRPFVALLTAFGCLGIVSLDVFAKAEEKKTSKKGKPYVKKEVAPGNKVEVEAAPSELAVKGIDLYKAGKYREALNTFEECERNGENTCAVHYYMGQCYQQILQVKAAKDQYQWVLDFGHDTRYQGYARYALTTVEYYEKHRKYKGQGEIKPGARGPLSGSGRR